MPKPDYWPKDKAFRPIQMFLSHRISATLKTEDAARYNSLMELEGVKQTMDASIEKLASATQKTATVVADELEKQQITGGDVDYTVAELPSSSTQFALIAAEVRGGPGHAAGYKQDKAVPARWLKGTPRAEGATGTKQFWELLGKNRLEVRPGEWDILTVLVCKNDARWQKFEDCRANFRNITHLGAQESVDSFKNKWAISNGNAGVFPVIDPAIGECWLWSGQAMDIQHGIMSRGFQRVHCESNNTTGYGALGRGNYFTDKFSKALLYAMNLRNLYYGVAKGDDIRVLMLSRVLLGRWRSLEGAGKAELKAQRYAHNVELTGSAQQHKRDTSKGYAKSVEDYRDAKLARAPMAKGFKTAYQITGGDVDANIGYESVQMAHKGSNEFLVAMGKQMYPEFMVFVKKG
jgi:hypothetical protein